MTQLDRRLADPLYMKFPLEISTNGATTSTRSEHIREQIEQALFTNPGDRVFRPAFGAGVRALVFEPNGSALWEMTKKRLASTLSEVPSYRCSSRKLLL